MSAKQKIQCCAKPKAQREHEGGVDVSGGPLALPGSGLIEQRCNSATTRLTTMATVTAIAILCMMAAKLGSSVSWDAEERDVSF